MLAKIIRRIRGIIEPSRSLSYEATTDLRVERGGVENPRYFRTVAEAVSFVERGGQPIEIVDFGGAAGEMARSLVAAFADIRVTVVENPTMVRMARRSPGVEFSTEIPSECDVFFSSCSIFYVPNPLERLEEGFRSARSAVVLVRNSWSEKPISRMQKSWLSDNGSGPLPPDFKDVLVSYPHQTVRESDVLAMAQRRGFIVVFREPNTDGVLRKGRHVYGADLVFKRDHRPPPDAR